jgi:hypothetical protein
LISHWSSLTAVAEALLEHKALDGLEVDRLIWTSTRRRSCRPG